MRAYPWHDLPRWSRREASLAGRMADLVAGASGSRSTADALARALEVPVSVEPGRVGASEASCLEAELSPSPVAVAIELPAGRIAIELEPAMALAAVDRVLGGEGTSSVAPAPLTTVEQGVLAFLAARACEGTEAVVVDVLGTREGVAAWLGEGVIGCWGLTLALGGRRAPARVWAPERTLARVGASRRPPLSREVRELPLVLTARLGRASLPVGEVARLAPADVLLPDELGCVRSATGRVEPSELALVSHGGTAVVRLAREGADWIVRALEGTASPRSALVFSEAAMTDAKEEIVGTDELAVVAEVPVEVSIELGRIELRVSELAALVPGRVISARIPVGGPVELRAGGRLIATGELVDVEGELGVRILARR